MLDVSLSRIGCHVEAASIALLGAPAGAWLSIGTTDVYKVGRIALGCQGSLETSSFRLDPGTATAAAMVASTPSRRDVTLQPGGLLRLPPVSADPRLGRGSFHLVVEPGGEAGTTYADFVVVARPHCRADVRVLVSAERYG